MLNSYYNKMQLHTPDIPIHHLHSKGIYVGYDEDSQNWYRVQVDLREGIRSDMVKAFKIDFGRTIYVKRTNLRYLILRYSHMPRQAFQADLWCGAGTQKLDGVIKDRLNEALMELVGSLFKVYVAVQLPERLTGTAFLRTCIMSLKS